MDYSMCLYLINNQHPFIAEENIPCYKVVDKTKGGYLTPFQKYPIDKVPCDVVAQGDHDLSFLGSHPVITGGFIHVYLDKACAINATELAFLHGTVVLEGYIPKGTTYFKEELEAAAVMIHLDKEL